MDKRLSSIKGVHQVHSDSSTGNIVMHYDTEQRRMPEFVSAIALAVSLVTDLPAGEIEDLFEIGEQAPQVLAGLDAPVKTVTHGFAKLLRGQTEAESVVAILVVVLGARFVFR